MLPAARVDGRRVFALGIAGLVPGALLTLLYVHQPSIGERRLYPMLRGSLALLGLALALATLITWVTTDDRLSRASLSGMAWAGVTAILCIGPFLESTPRARLYALELATGDVEWASNRAGTAPVVVDDYLVVTDVETRTLVWLDPVTFEERDRQALAGAETLSLVERALAMGAFVPPARDGTVVPSTSAVVASDGVQVVDGHLEARGADPRESWTLSFPGEVVLAVATTEDSAYAYVSTPGADGVASGAVVRLDSGDGAFRWRSDLPAGMAVVAGPVELGASADAVVVAGGELIGLLDAADGTLRWKQNVVTLGKSRGYALPGAVHQIAITDSYVFLSTTPDT